MRVIYMKTDSIGTIMNTSRDAHSTQLFAYFSYRYHMTLIDSFHRKPRIDYLLFVCLFPVIVLSAMAVY